MQPPPKIQPQMFLATLTLHTQGLPTHGMMAACLRDILIYSYKFVPTILRPTRITEFSATLIDNIFTNSLCQDLDSCILIEDISDHLPILLFLNLNPPSTTNPINLNKRD